MLQEIDLIRVLSINLPEVVRNNTFSDEYRKYMYYSIIIIINVIIILYFQIVYLFAVLMAVLAVARKSLKIIDKKIN